MTVKKGASTFALSTIPFFSVYIGTYSMLVPAMKREKGEPWVLCLFRFAIDENARSFLHSLCDASMPFSYKLTAFKIATAVSSTALACAAEVPFDESKKMITAGDKRVLMQATALRVPLGALLLLAYDAIRTSV